MILARGTLVMPVDPAYPPASFAVKRATRAPDTACSPDELTAPEVSGYDVEISKAVAAGLGVEACFVTPTWSQLLAGNWADRWDISFSSIGITQSRTEQLYFTQPYYATPESFYVRTDAPYARVQDLSGQRIGVCVGCFADLYLQHKLQIPSEPVHYLVDDADIVGYDIELVGLHDVGKGKLDAFLCQNTVGDEAISQGVALKTLGDPAYVAYPAGAVDRSSDLDQAAFVTQVDQVLRTLLDDGTASRLSRHFYGVDFAKAAAAFDISSVSQPPM